jgi:1,5-anhydro-D-fructose reductase (1,5-anhydro-D-mannitol-forming)
LTRVRVAVIGLGLIGRQRAAAVDGIEHAELVATVDPGTSPYREGVRHFSAAEDLPPDTFDAAVVAVPHDLARPVVESVFSARKPVLLEKPLGRSAREAAGLVEASRQATGPSFVGYNYRFLPSFQRLAAALRSGSLGTLRSADLQIGHGGNPRSADGWKLDPARAGGGVLLDPGVHLLDLLLQLAPNAKLESILATRGFWPSGIEEDLALAFSDEHALATVRVSHIRWVNTFRVEAFGEDGYAIAEGRGGNYGPITLRLGRRWGWNDHAGKTQRETEEFCDFAPTDTSLRDELAAVVERWLGAGPPDGIGPATFADARRIADLCDELYAQIATV